MREQMPADRSEWLASLPSRLNIVSAELVPGPLQRLHLQVQSEDGSLVGTFVLPVSGLLLPSPDYRTSSSQKTSSDHDPST